MAWNRAGALNHLLANSVSPKQKKCLASSSKRVVACMSLPLEALNTDLAGTGVGEHQGSK